MQVLLKLFVPNVPLSIANWALKVCKGVEIELCRVMVSIFKITMSVCSPDLNACMHVCRKYYGDLTLHPQVRSKGMVKVLQFKATV